MQLTPGSAMGPYRLTEPAGAGGMAQVWRAYDTRLDRYVAIKFLSPQYATDPTYLERFRREARSISRLDHPNVLTVHDFGEQDGWTYMVSPFIGGGTLAARLHRGPWTVAEAIAVLEPLAAALDYAHGAGLVHRDVKPSNVLFNEHGRLVLSDFGIARMVEGSTLLSQAGLVVGTPMYMSPEQADGEPAGPPSDLYSLGVVAYQMLTGRPPFMGETPLALLRAHLDKPLPPPRALNPALPELAEAALFKIMAKSPSDRHASGAAFVTALRAASAEPSPVPSIEPAHAPAPAPRPIPAPRAAPPATPTPLPPSPESAIHLDRVVPLTGNLGQQTGAPASEPPAPMTTVGATLPTAAATPSRVGRTMPTVAASSPWLSDTALLSGEGRDDTSGRPRRLSRRQLLVGGGAAVLVAAGVYEFLLVSSQGDTGATARLTPTAVSDTGPTPTRPPAPVAVPATTATASGPPSVPATLVPAVPVPATQLPPTPFLLPLPAARQSLPAANDDPALILTLIGHRRGVVKVAFSPNGKVICSGSADGIRFWNAPDGSPLRTVEGYTSGVESVAFSPDGQTLASGSSSIQENVHFWHVADGSPIRTTGHNSGVWSVAFSPNGELLASGSDDGTARFWSVADGSEVRLLKDPSSVGAFVHGVAFSPDGATLATAADDSAVRIWRVADASLIRTLKGQRNQVRAVAVAPDGRTVASGAYDATIRLWRLDDGSPLRTLTGHEGPVECVAFTPDGKTLVSGSKDATARLWHVEDGSQTGVRRANAGIVGSVAISPDGQMLASGHEKSIVCLWRMA